MNLLANPPDRVAGVVLAGGRSRRMGEDKAGVLLGGQTMASRVIALMRPQVCAIALSSNAFFDQNQNLPVISDGEFSFEGPLAGILAGMRWTLRDVPPASWIATVPTDAPFLPRDLVARLLAANPSPSVARIAASEGNLHPVVGLWPVTLAPTLETWLATGRSRRVRDWLAEIAHVVVAFENDDAFFNVNTPADMKAATVMLLESVP
jgi:molybdopterin-guanine dinucleotide biosynthesis protein A